MVPQGGNVLIKFPTTVFTMARDKNSADIEYTFLTL